MQPGQSPNGASCRPNALNRWRWRFWDVWWFDTTDASKQRGPTNKNTSGRWIPNEGPPASLSFPSYKAVSPRFVEERSAGASSASCSRKDTSLETKNNILDTGLSEQVSETTIKSVRFGCFIFPWTKSRFEEWSKKCWVVVLVALVFTWTMHDFALPGSGSLTAKSSSYFCC